MKRIFKIFFYTIFILATLLFTTLFAVSYVYDDEISSVILKELNKEIEGEIQVKNISFSLIEKFPYASLEFENVIALSSHNFNRKNHSINTDTAIVAKHLYIQFNILQFINKEYTLHKISLEDAILNVYKDKSGELNVQYYKSDQDTVKSNIHFEIKSLSLKNVKTTYWDSKVDLLFQGFINTFSFSGDFSSDEFTINSESELNCYRLRKEQLNLIENKDFSFDASLHVLNNFYTIEKFILDQDDVSLEINGNIAVENDIPVLDMHLRSEEASISKLLHLIPADTYKKISKFALNGLISYDASLKGSFEKESLPSLSVTYNINKGSMLLNNRKITINSEGTFQADDLKDITTFRVNTLSTRVSLGKSIMKGRVSLKNFKKLIIDADVETFLVSRNINELLPKNDSLVWYGILEGPVKFRGALSEFSFDNYSNFFVNTKLQLRSGYFEKKGVFPRIHDIKGEISIKNTSIFVDSLHVFHNGSHIIITGFIKDLHKYISKNRANMLVDISIDADKIDINDFIPKTKNTTSSTKSTIAFPFNYIKLNAGIHCQEFIYDKLVVRDISTNIKANSGHIKISNFGCKTLKGTFFGNIALSSIGNKYYNVFGTARTNKISISDIFYTFNNFDQDFIKDSHLKGAISTNTHFSFDLSPDFKLIEKSLLVQTDAEIDDGALLNFEPALELSKFVELSELQNITFSKLSNSIIIRNDSIFIPQMKISSNAFNIELSGIQNIESDFDYRVEILLNEILSKKHKKNRSTENFGEIEDDGLGRTKLYLRVKGNPDNFDVSWDKKKARDTRKEKIKDEKQELRRIFKEEFKNRSQDTTFNNTVNPDETIPTEDFEYDFDDIL